MKKDAKEKRRALGRELERMVKTHGWDSPEVRELEARFWKEHR